MVAAGRQQARTNGTREVQREQATVLWVLFEVLWRVHIKVSDWGVTLSTASDLQE